MDLDDYLPPTSAAKRSVHDRDAIFPMVTRARAWEPTPPPLARVEPIVTRSSAKKAKHLDSRRKDEEMLDEDMMQTPTAKAPNPKFSSVAVEPNAKKTPKVREDGTTYRWTEEEHSRFLEALALHGFDLTKIAQHIETRDSNQCKSHAQKYFDKPENAAAIGLPRVFVQFRKMRYLFGSSFSA
jgi:SHAQKYF class myb-like DNA-binding protein